MTLTALRSAVAVAAIFAAGTASAATVTFGPSNWDYNESGQIPYTVVIDDDTTGKFTFTISTNGSAGTDTGDMLGFGFNTTLAGIAASDFAFVSSSNGEGITGTYSNTLSCGSGCNFNGATNTNFDWIVRMGDNGSGNGMVTSFVFTLDTNAALTDSLFSRVGIRAQSVGAFPKGGKGSSKDLNDNPVFDDPSPVPLPAAGLLLLGGIGGLGALRAARRRG